ncbi:hypothetical protein [Streptomyces sp. AS02]|uniref:hypothetical protein n=1 Tax=Streptomyces sp. AS02 TaxID=2938946 RepID=UPI002021AD62|nr:hypothetical protein [Streptomyces sp. AS02]MCL8011597.1 hypothetical protein [Streptomyces sp. AS02]
MAQFGASPAASLVLTVFLRDRLGLSALLTAAVTLPSAVAMGVTSGLAWRLVWRIGPRTVIVGLVLGVGAAPAGSVVAFSVPMAVPPVALAGTRLVAGAASGLSVAPNQVLQQAPAEAAGVGGGILQMAQRIAAALCLSAVFAVYPHAAPGPRAPAIPAGYALASCVGAVLLAAALVLSLPRRAATRTHPSERTAAEPADPVSAARKTS